MFGISPAEMIFVGIVGLLLFGKKLPDVAKQLGKGIMEFKKGMHGFEDVVRGESSYQSSTPVSRPAPPDVRDDATAPKFEPPQFEPTASS
jgi:sec-independent protein translocase protein TatA